MGRGLRVWAMGPDPSASALASGGPSGRVGPFPPHGPSFSARGVPSDLGVAPRSLGLKARLRSQRLFRFPLVVILAEVASQLRQRSMALSLGWAPREQNEEADALTNGDFSQRKPANRVNFVIEEVKWLICPRCCK